MGRGKGFPSPRAPRFLILSSQPPCDTIGSFSNYNGDGTENVKKAIGLISKTTTLHVQDTFWYISLPSLHDYDVKIPNLTFYGGRKQATTNFSFYFKT